MELSEWTMGKLGRAREVYAKWEGYFKSKYGRDACALDDDGLVSCALTDFADRLEELMHRMY